MEDLPGLRCLADDFVNQHYKDDDYATESSYDQAEVEKKVKHYIDAFKQMIDLEPGSPFLLRTEHMSFSKKGLSFLSGAHQALDSSRPWLLYWMLHTIELLGGTIQKEKKSHIIEFLKICQHPEGGFCGGPGQEPHLASTYPAVCALCVLQCQEAYDVIDREKLLQFLFKLKQADGSFQLHSGSESDIRGTYCALSVAMLTNVWCKALTANTAHWISRCQTYEGGFGGVPGMEAHGGYTFCGLASLVLLKEANLINVHNLLRWLVNRQMSYEGGFQGRTNKLVDSCYSYWQGAAFPLVHRILNRTVSEDLRKDGWLFDQRALQEYILINCQDVHGGMIDKPDKARDHYHTCYALSGLSIAQHFYDGENTDKPIVGTEANELVPTHPVYNICVDSAMAAIQHFQSLPYPNLPPDIKSEDQES